MILEALRVLPLLALAASPLSAGYQESFNQPFLHEAFVALRTLDATREHAAFVVSHKVDLVVAAPEDGIEDDTLGLYDGDTNTMYVNEGMLESAQDALKERGVADEDIPKVLAWKFLPTLAHEIRHAMMADALKTRLGIEWHYATLEDEMVAFVDTVRILQASIAAKPEYWTREMLVPQDETNGRLLEEWRKDPTALKELVAPLYASIPSLFSSSHEDIVKLFAGRERRCRDTLAKIEEGRASVAKIADPGRRRAAAAELARSEASARKALQRNQRNLKWLSDPANFKRLQDVYKKAIQALIRLTP